MSVNDPNEEHYLSLASYPLTIPNLLDLAKRAVEDRPEDPDLRKFLPAFIRAREALAPGTRYLVPETGAQLIVDRSGLNSGIDEAERSIIQALSNQ